MAGAARQGGPRRRLRAAAAVPQLSRGDQEDPVPLGRALGMVGRSHPPQALFLAWLLLAATRAGEPSVPREPDELWAELGTNDPEKADHLTTSLVARPG